VAEVHLELGRALRTLHRHLAVAALVDLAIEALQVGQVAGEEALDVPGRDFRDLPQAGDDGMMTR
jgi:hypothetical protein